ncbi:glutaminase GtaA [Talaromyces proteolyticus]|uniref:Glutaminase GtaA n=1 Tax=Talaromyces proteolyticus TaxID=1131652 RepID=A0AAD4KM78_9EURO|nr:glutaminase GtaA [Talaromyces proteolyticus]KAH8692346.1 glutaminase GtaA [Talaromyces proteolyticus]
MTPIVILSLLLSLLPSSIRAASTFSPARPPAQPLAVKSPYLSAWQEAGSDGGNGGYLAGQWPTFWAGATLGWTGLINVDGSSYCWMGAPLHFNTVDQVSYNYTSSSSTYVLSVDGKVQITATFTSPITPDDFKRQSLIFSYLNVDVVSLDGSEHDVQLYSDISAEWVSGDRGQVAQWEYGTNDSVAYHKVYRQNQGNFQEVNDQTEYGNWWYSTTTDKGYTYQSGIDVDVRAQFGNHSTLTNAADTNYRAINSDWPVFAHSFDLGSVGTTSTSRLFTVGLTQQDAIQFLGADGVVPLPSLWTQYFPDEVSAVVFVQGDYATASSLTAKLDAKVQSDAAAVSDDYATLATLSLRQAFGGVQLVGTNDTQYLFLKEISSDGNIQTVDVIFPAHPAYVYTNPLLMKLLLEPLFVNQEAGQYPNSWSMHDLGSHYPNATGHTDGKDEQMPLEECGDMLIMALEYYLAANDTDFLTKHYKLLDQWTQFLIQEALYPSNQISTDDFAGPLVNQTNLALKGMIGIKAMSVIANVTGNNASASNYSSIATDYITQWQTLGFNTQASPAHAKLNYNNDSSWGLLYNLYGDKALGLDLVPQSVYDTQSTFYLTVNDTYGVPLDTRHSYTKGDWESWVAAVCSDEVSEMLFSELAKWINVTPTNRPLTDWYDTVSGDYNGGPFINRPVMGGVFAKLVLDMGLHP